MTIVLFIFKRLARLGITLIVISTLVFFIIRVIPGDPAQVIAGVDATPADVAAIQHRLGTDRPLAEQYVSWIGSAFRLDFGESFTYGEPVTRLIGERFPLTLSLALLGFGIALAVALPLGVASAVRRWSLVDYIGMVYTQAGMAIPGFWLGILLLLAFAVRLQIFPLFGAGSLAHLVLPALALGIGRSAIILRLMRGSMAEELDREYVLAARAKGLPPRAIYYGHALRNALMPVITVSGIQFGYMLGGAIIIEQVFSLPGLGRLFLSSIFQRDFPVIQGGVFFIAAVFTLVNFLADVLYSVVNPRIRIR